MTATIQILLLLLAVLVLAAVIARRLNTAPSIVLVIAGVALALIPGLPRVELAPELVLLVILPPLIYSAGVAMSWREFRFNLRPIALLAFGCVIFTTGAVALAAHYVLGLPWAVGFLLGAIVAPPDVVAPLAIARRLGIPRRLLVVLEGEGLANDATALILYRFAVVAISTGMFSPMQAAGTFAAIVVGEIAWGIGVGWLALHLRRLAREPRVEIVLSLMTPYLAYWVPEHLGGSGVLATVAAGLYVSWNGPLLIPSATRLQGVFFWDLIIYMIEGLVFLLTGLQARTLVETAQTFSLRDLAIATSVIGAICVVARFVWVFPAVYVPRWISPSLRKRDPAPPWTWAFVLSYTGVRGVVSLAAALAIPLTLANGQPFPQRDLILFITFGVIIVTLVGLGLMMPLVIRALGVARHRAAEHRREQEAELAARHAAMDAALRDVEQHARERGLPEDVLALARARHDARAQQFPKTMEEGWDAVALGAKLRKELIAAEREYLYELLRDGKITDESRRKLERELDLEEAMIACKEGEA
ncbi:MAG: monovalent cation/hydrogen antiporter [Alphaproteobacteria bacterium]|nr:monovalent cation/hydrogen antiporter [Alphaproteobacteria bacterium]